LGGVAMQGSASYNATGNTAIGYAAHYLAGSSTYNASVGYATGYNMAGGDYNSLFGSHAGYDVTSGQFNTIIGYNTGRGITTGSNNTIIGGQVIGLSSGLTNNIIIADGSGNRRINVDSNGHVGIGSVPNGARLHVSQTVAANIGIDARATNNIGVYALSQGSYGIQAESNTNYGIYGRTNSASYGGVLGYTANSLTYGIVAFANNWSFYGNSSTYVSGYARSDSGVRTNQVCDVNGNYCNIPSQITAGASCTGGRVHMQVWATTGCAPTLYQCRNGGEYVVAVLGDQCAGGGSGGP
jgi:hypothetical protein